MARDKWERRYRDAPPGALFGPKPTEFLAKVAASSWFTAKSALMLADGDGRNGRFLARQGLAVCAVDFSANATHMAEALDGEAGVDVKRLVGDLRSWRPQPADQFDFAASIFLQSDEQIRHRAIATGLACVKPGGLFLLEGFARTNSPGSGPAEAALRYDRDGVAPLLEGCDLIINDSGRQVLDEGLKHRGPADVIRLLVRKRV